MAPNPALGVKVAFIIFFSKLLHVSKQALRADIFVEPIDLLKDFRKKLVKVLLHFFYLVLVEFLNPESTSYFGSGSPLKRPAAPTSSGSL